MQRARQNNFGEMNAEDNNTCTSYASWFFPPLIRISYRIDVIISLSTAFVKGKWQEFTKSLLFLVVEGFQEL